MHERATKPPSKSPPAQRVSDTPAPVAARSLSASALPRFGFAALPVHPPGQPPAPAQLRAGPARPPRSNRTGLPDRLKSGVEALSGVSLDGVKVHYNSPKPAQLDAHAYARGREIHLAPGQERHLPHEAWHLVQQAQGRVRPTSQTNGVSINGDAALEAEATRLGGAAQAHGAAAGPIAAQPIERSQRPDPGATPGPAQLMRGNARRKYNALDATPHNQAEEPGPAVAKAEQVHKKLSWGSTLLSMAKHAIPTASRAGGYLASWLPPAMAGLGGVVGGALAVKGLLTHRALGKPVQGPDQSGSQPLNARVLNNQDLHASRAAKIDMAAGTLGMIGGGLTMAGDLLPGPAASIVGGIGIGVGAAATAVGAAGHYFNDRNLRGKMVAENAAHPIEMTSANNQAVPHADEEVQGPGRGLTDDLMEAAENKKRSLFGQPLLPARKDPITENLRDAMHPYDEIV